MMNPERDPQRYSKDAIKIAAENWRPVTLSNYRPGSHEAYDTASRLFLVSSRNLLETNFQEDTPKQVLETGGAPAGFKVVGRFFYAGAVHAASQGMSQEELTSLMYKQGSFTSLQQLTREWNESALHIEQELGLNGPLYDDDDRIKNGFSLNDTKGLVIKNYPILSYRARDSSADKAPDTMKENTVRCLAQSTGVLPYVYKHMLDIMGKDPSLFKATLNSKY